MCNLTITISDFCQICRTQIEDLSARITEPCSYAKSIDKDCAFDLCAVMWRFTAAERFLERRGLPDPKLCVDCLKMMEKRKAEASKSKSKSYWRNGKKVGRKRSEEAGQIGNKGDGAKEKRERRGTVIRRETVTRRSVLIEELDTVDSSQFRDDKVCANKDDIISNKHNGPSDEFRAPSKTNSIELDRGIIDSQVDKQVNESIAQANGVHNTHPKEYHRPTRSTNPTISTPFIYSHTPVSTPGSSKNPSLITTTSSFFRLTPSPIRIAKPSSQKNTIKNEVRRVSVDSARTQLHQKSMASAVFEDSDADANVEADTKCIYRNGHDGDGHNRDDEISGQTENIKKENEADAECSQLEGHDGEADNEDEVNGEDSDEYEEMAVIGASISTFGR